MVVGDVVEGELGAGGVGLSCFWGAGVGGVVGAGVGLVPSGVVPAGRAGTGSWPEGSASVWVDVGCVMDVNDRCGYWQHS